MTLMVKEKYKEKYLLTREAVAYRIYEIYLFESRVISASFVSPKENHGDFFGQKK